jgi:hypothetical protein
MSPRWTTADGAFRSRAVATSGNWWQMRNGKEGVDGHHPPYDVTPTLRFAFVDDPDGNTILLSAYSDRAEP